MNNSMWGFIGIFVLCCGIYALYSFVIMKVKGEINASILLGKDYTYKKCKDKEAYIAKTAPALFAFGLVSVIYGVIDVIHCYVHTVVKMMWMEYNSNRLRKKKYLKCARTLIF